MDYNVIIHSIIFCVAFVAAAVLLKTLRRIDHDEFVVIMVVLSLALMITAASYSVIYLIDKIDGQLFDVSFYNYFSLFIRSQECFSILLIGIKALHRVGKP